MPWTNDEVMALIAEYEQRPVLWNAFLDGYKDRALKADTWVELSYVMQKDRHEVEKKVHALRVQFNEELRKLEKKRLTCGSDELPRSAWQYFDALSFIVAGCKKKKVAPSHPQVLAPMFRNADGSHSLTFEEQAAALALTTTAATSGHHTTSTSNTPRSTSTSYLMPGASLFTAKGNTSSGIHKKFSYDPKGRKQALERVCNTADKPKLDEYSAFSAYITSEFCSLKSESVKKRLKRNIMCALMRASEEDDAERNLTNQPQSQLTESQNNVSSAPSPREPSSPNTSFDDYHTSGLESVTNQMVGVIDNVIRNGRTEEKHKYHDNNNHHHHQHPTSNKMMMMASDSYMKTSSPERPIIKEEVVEFNEDDKSREREQSPEFPEVHVTLSEGEPSPQRKRRRNQYEDSQSSNMSPHHPHSNPIVHTDYFNPHDSNEEEDLFGRYIAAAIKKLPWRFKSIAKMRIQHVVFESEEADRLGKDYSLNITINNR